MELQCIEILSSPQNIRKFHLISWCGIFLETDSFCRVSGESLVYCALAQNFHIRKLVEISVFFAAAVVILYSNHKTPEKDFILVNVLF